MKKLLIAILIVMCVSITGCTAYDFEESEERETFKRVYQDNDVIIFVDTETSVMYVSKNNGHGGTALIVMVDQNGKPRLYEENEHDGERSN